MKEVLILSNDLKDKLGVFNAGDIVACVSDNMTGTIKIKYKNNDEQCLNVVMPLEKNEYKLVKLVHKHLVSEIKASHFVNRHSSVKDLESFIRQRYNFIFSVILN